MAGIKYLLNDGSRVVSTSLQYVRDRRHLFEVLFVALVCATFGFFVICFARSSSPTYDEITDLPAGYTYLRWHDYRLNPEHPPLMKKLCALPMIWSRIWSGETESTGEEVTLPVGDSNLPTDSTNGLRRAWINSIANIDEQWNFGHFLLYGMRNESLLRLRDQNPSVINPYSVPGTTSLSEKDFYNDANELVFRGRVVVLFLGVLLAVLVYLWARELFGTVGAGLSILLLCCDPNMIAHSGLVTNDLAVTLFIFGTVYFLWRVCRRAEPFSVILFLSFCAAAFVTKFSAIVLAPVLLVIALARIISSKEWPFAAKEGIRVRSLLGRMTALLILIVAAVGAIVLAIWACYGFRYSAANDPQKAAAAEATGVREDEKVSARTIDRLPGHFPLAAELYLDGALTAEMKSWPRGVPPEKANIFEANIKQRIEGKSLTLTGRVIWFANKHRLLPEAYLYGFAHIARKSHARGAFLRGEYSDVGFRSYYFWTFLLKTPLPILLAIIAAIIFAVACHRPRESWVIFIASPIVIYWLFAISAHVNIGHRYLLPIYPFLYVLCGLLALEWRKLRPKWRWRSALISLTLLAISSQFVFSPPWRPARIHPHYLAYFNELSGGPRSGSRNLVDSNLDWGQELKALRIWLDQRKINEPIWLSYFGTADPRFYQIRHWNVPQVLGGYEFESSQYDALETDGRYEEALRHFVRDLRPGQYIAISATNLSGVYLGRDVHDVWQRILDHCTYVDAIGYSIFIYRFGAKR